MLRVLGIFIKIITLCLTFKVYLAKLYSSENFTYLEQFVPQIKEDSLVY